MKNLIPLLMFLVTWNQRELKCLNCVRASDGVVSISNSYPSDNAVYAVEIATKTACLKTQADVDAFVGNLKVKGVVQKGIIPDSAYNVSVEEKK